MSHQALSLSKWPSLRRHFDGSSHRGDRGPWQAWNGQPSWSTSSRSYWVLSKARVFYFENSQYIYINVHIYMYTYVCVYLFVDIY